SACYLKGIAPPQVKLTEIFAGCMPFLLCVFISMVLMYLFPQIVFYLPTLFYGS
ncbi:MAG: C4-dicarboxylate ABC transporter, partial [Mangrovicoccus sp.]